MSQPVAGRLSPPSFLIFTSSSPSDASYHRTAGRVPALCAHEPVCSRRPACEPGRWAGRLSATKRPPNGGDPVWCSATDSEATAKQ